MKKTPVGWFTDPATKTLIVILARDGESPTDAIARVASAHAVPVTDVLQKAPATGEGTPMEIDVPSAGEPRGSQGRASSGENPAMSVNRFTDRAAKARQMPPLEPPIITSLLPGAGGGPK